MDFIKIRNYCASKDTIKKVNRQPTELEEIFANHISDKEFVSRINNFYNSTTMKNK